MEKKKKTAEDRLKSIICQDCLSSADEKGFDQYMFHWVSMPAGYNGLFCENCIKEFDLTPIRPYTKKPVRKKKSDK